MSTATEIRKESYLKREELKEELEQVNEGKDYEGYVNEMCNKEGKSREEKKNIMNKFRGVTASDEHIFSGIQSSRKKYSKANWEVCGFNSRVVNKYSVEFKCPELKEFERTYKVELAALGI